MKRYIAYLCSLFLLFTPGYLTSIIPSAISGSDLPLDISLKNPVYKNGLIHTDEGGTVQGKDLYLQAIHITYSKKEKEQELSASGQLLFYFKGKLYRAESVRIDFLKETIEAKNAIAKSGDWYITCEKATLGFDGNGFFQNAALTTGENEHDDWNVRSHEVTFKKNDSIEAHPVVFSCEKLPIMWLPSYKKSLKEEDDLHLRYRVRWGGGSKFIVGVSTLVYQTESWLHRFMVDYSGQDGLGFGLRSTYHSLDTPTRFECLNYVAQSKNYFWDIRKTRYILQGGFISYYDKPNIKVHGMYDLMSDKRVQVKYPEHRARYTDRTMTKLTMTKPEDAYIARLNARLRLNNWQAVKQELPLFSFNQLPFELGSSGCVVQEKLSAGYINYVFPHSKHHQNSNFNSTRCELDQRFVRPFTVFPFQITPWAGWRAVQYNHSPHEGGSIIQALAEGGLRIDTHLTGFSPSTIQFLEPFADLYMSTSPHVASNRPYIFDIQDSYARVCYVRPGIQHTVFIAPNTSGFQQSFYSELFATFFFNTPHLSSNKPRIRFNETWNMTERLSWKAGLEYDVRHHSMTFGNILAKYTINDHWATTFEVRGQDKWYFRKMDRENFDIESFRSLHKLRSSQLSDPRSSCIWAIIWSPSPQFDANLSTIRGRRKYGPHCYYAEDLQLGFLLFGSMRLTFEVWKQSNKKYGVNLKLHVGQPKGHSSMPFTKIGQGNPDIW